MARVMAKKSAKGGEGRHLPVRKAAERGGFFSRTVLIGIGLAVGGWVAGSLASMQGLALSVHERTLSAPLAIRVAEARPTPNGERIVHSVKFKRIAPAAGKAERLTHADLAHRSANRPQGDLVRERLQAAFRADEENRRIAAVLEKRPEAETVRTALAAALSETLTLAPRSNVAWNAPEEASVEVASIDADTVRIMEQAAVEETVAEAESGALPAAVPLPVRRPAVATRPDRPAKPAPAVAARDAEEPATKALAFARPDNPARSLGKSVPWPDRGTKIAVYDITNAVVHMPNGEKLEAHSGIGEMRDNPKFTHVKMRGATPPGTYKLTMREKLFHGVAAIRLNPIDGIAPKGRTGLLAHSYLLPRKGDSHGCVAFAQYDRFLKAFRRGEVTHMVIVERHDGRRPTLSVAQNGDKPKRTLVDYMRAKD
ncbi:DUF2778 domain-containing protein [Rhizobiaceae bacterium BDR2-2]|uniref:DUF2778 domain-containing protein n=1 Tax=Ectorhizobium quercum TaxID=2965071 RepID=A0AAE3N077_9HYPH|nr:DUF2778 domain-containing protein [Ectorhizobium quercum]MCX8996437.1 DUF2778 domain-containing protein [Ectorhizobium quercum]